MVARARRVRMDVPMMVVRSGRVRVRPMLVLVRLVPPWLWRQCRLWLSRRLRVNPRVRMMMPHARWMGMCVLVMMPRRFAHAWSMRMAVRVLVPFV